MDTSRKVHHRVSARQVEMLWEFLNSNRDIATAYNRSLQAKDYAQKKWKEITAILNSQGDGAHKDWRGWSKYWVDYKAKLKSKVAALRYSYTRTGGGPSTEKPLIEIEEKFLQILGENFGQGLPGVRVEPFVEPAGRDINTIEMQVQESPSSESILQLYVPHFIHVPEPHPPELNPTLSPRPITVPHTPHFTTSPATPPLAPAPPPAPSATSPTAPPTAHTPRHRRRRRPTLMSPGNARQTLVLAAQKHADAAEQSTRELMKIVEIMERMER